MSVAKCVDPSLHQISVTMSWLTNSLDVLTDILSESPPSLRVSNGNRFAKLRISCQHSLDHPSKSENSKASKIWVELLSVSFYRDDRDRDHPYIQNLISWRD